MELEGRIDFTRWRDGFDPTEQTTTATIFGCGGIGSPVAMALTKFGISRLVLIDYDTVEPHNLPNQAFRVDQVGELKVHALTELVSDFGVSEVRACPSKLTEDGWEGDDAPMAGIVINAPDSMEARSLCAEKALSSPMVTHIVDPRIAGEYIRLETCNTRDSDSVEAYRSTLYSDGDAMDAPCTRQSVIWVANFVAGLTARAVGRILEGEKVEESLGFNSANHGMFLMAGDRPGS